MTKVLKTHLLLNSFLVCLILFSRVDASINVNILPTSVNGYDNYNLITDCPMITSYIEDSNLSMLKSPTNVSLSENTESYRLDFSEDFYDYELIFQYQHEVSFTFDWDFHIILESKYDYNGICNEENNYPIGRISLMSSSHGYDVYYVITDYPFGTGNSTTSYYLANRFAYSMFNFTRNGFTRYYLVSIENPQTGFQDVDNYVSGAGISRPLNSIVIAMEIHNQTIGNFTFFLDSFEGELLTYTDFGSNNFSQLIKLPRFEILVYSLIVFPILFYRKMHSASKKRSK